MLLMLDNYDSFTYNLVQYFAELGQDVKVYRNDQITISEIEALNPEFLVVSPGPCTPNEAGISMDLIKHFSDKIPLLGVCLGHQAIAQVFGGKVVRAHTVMHGKTSDIIHTNLGVFSNLNNPLRVTRYHSLVVEDLPDCLEVTAWTQEEKPIVMGIKHKTLPIQGVQFHPESILTDQGHALLDNFLKQL
jgi:anthranilate synthase component 2